MLHTSIVHCEGVPPPYAAGRGQTTSRHEILDRELRLTPVTMRDLSDFQGLVSDPVAMRWVGLERGKPMSAAAAEATLAGAVQGWKTRGWGRWSIFSRSTGKYLGFCGFRCEQGEPELI